ncbi:hypothetical protein BDA96_02G162400 [Sorghum bicolor]|uniref:Uncharacterized protein n=2 Tax=Sorghum bicolor TaxID=4558 RepID=A0A921USJ9_SORBI|nr:hypothetical protein BDA96_02G162400 [Sorghum bicolor]KXG35305.1 hypothetical protein SORBI_3002G155800 [Sorghum bicolor]
MEPRSRDRDANGADLRPAGEGETQALILLSLCFPLLAGAGPLSSDSGVPTSRIPQPLNAALVWQPVGRASCITSPLPLLSNCTCLPTTRPSRMGTGTHEDRQSVGKGTHNR